MSTGELNFRFGSRLKARNVCRILLENDEEDIWVVVYDNPDPHRRHITVSVLALDVEFAHRILLVDGIPSSDTRSSMLEGASLWQEMYKGERVRQFPAWTRR